MQDVIEYLGVVAIYVAVSFEHDTSDVLNVVKCSEVLQCCSVAVLQCCSDGLGDKVSKIIRRHKDNRKLLLIYSLSSMSYQYMYGCIPV